MRVRKRRPARPGEEFLEALASSREDREDPGEDDAEPVGEEVVQDEHARLIATEERAYTAEEALRQLRVEADSRLEDAREAITRERERRLELEDRLAVADHPEPAAPEPSEAGEISAPVAAAEPEPTERSEAPGPEHASGQVDRRAAWPTPWIDRDESATGGRRRRFFGRRNGA